VGFILEVMLAINGVGAGYWTWRVPALIVVTLGPPGAFIVHRRLAPKLTSAASRG
jgi:hypothetical protein